MHKEKLTVTKNGVEIYDYKNPASHSYSSAQAVCTSASRASPTSLSTRL